MSNTEDTAARLVAEMDQARALRVEAASMDASVLGGFYKTLRDAGMSEEQAFELTREWLLLTVPAEEPGDDE